MINSTNNKKYLVNETSDEMDWFKKVLSDKDIYDVSISDELNIIIAFEYYKFKSLLENNQIYGCLFQVKDIYEILIRLPVLIVASILLDKEEINKFEEKFLINLTLKKHTLGSWKSMLKSACDILSTYDESLLPLSQIAVETLTFSNDRSGSDNIDLVQWRNKYVGHGPLMLDSNPKLYDDIQIRLSQITAFLHKIKGHYTFIKFYNTESLQTPLMGCKSIEKIKSNNLILKVGEYGKYKPMSFIRVFEKGIYLYDSFTHKRNLVDMVEYYEGNREMFITNDFKDVLDNTTTTSNYSINDKSFSEEEKKISEVILNIDDYVEPTPLVHWLKGVLKQPKSISLLQLGKGMGKSTFVRSLDPFAMNKIQLPFFEVKTYYINPYFGSRLYTFSQQLHQTMLRRSDGENKQCDFQQLNTEIFNKSPEEEFIHMINKAKTNEYDDNKLLIIIDGLDELRRQPGYNIVDFIPNRTDMLLDDIHILITSRTTDKNDQLTDYTLECLAKFKDVNTFQIDVNSDEYIQMKKKYLNERLFQKYSQVLKARKIKFTITDEEKSIIHSMMKNENFLYLKQFKEITSIKINEAILAGTNEIDSSLFKVNQNILQEYFDILRRKSGKKYYKKFVRIVMAFILTNDHLTIQELSVFVENGTPSFAFLGFINTIRMFLTVERSLKGNRIGISHIEDVLFLKSHLEADFEDIIMSVYEKTKMFCDPNIIDYTDNQGMLLLAYFDQLLYSAQEVKIDKYKEIEEYYLERLGNVELDQNWSLTKSQIEWAIMYYQGLKTFYEYEESRDNSKISAIYKSSYINVLTMLGFFYYVKRFTKDSLKYLEKSYELAKDATFSDQDTCRRYRWFHSVMLFSLRVEDKIESGIEMTEIAKLKIDELKSKGYPIRSQDDGELLKNMATCYKGMDNFRKAYEQYKLALPMYYICESDNDIWELAHVMVLTGHCAMEIGLLDEAENYLLMSKEIRDRLYNETGYVKAYTGTSRNLKFLGTNSFKQEQFEKSLKYRTELLSYLEDVKTNLKLTNMTHYFEALYYKAESFHSLGRYKDSIDIVSSAYRYHSTMSQEEKMKRDNIIFLEKLDSLNTLLNSK